jgi:alkanesulfonate monooxygenase SsuD/methylene tetrahydromethanopterin reductase-like flavin-dependent oxidoreductase (luciferase family)
MTFEAAEMILKLWESDPPYELEGKYWTIRLKKTVDEETGIGYIHKPYQKPHPPIAIPGMNRNSYGMQYAGKKGFSPFAHCLIAGNVVADLWKTYAAAAEQADRPADRSLFRVSRSIFLADTTREAKERARTNSVGKNYQYIGRLFDKGLGRRLYKRDPNMSDADCNLDYLMTEQIIAGDVDEVLRRLLMLVEEVGPFGKLVMMSYDWDDKDAWLRSMELFQNELMPAFNKAVCGSMPRSVAV